MDNPLLPLEVPPESNGARPLAELAAFAPLPAGTEILVQTFVGGRWVDFLVMPLGMVRRHSPILAALRHEVRVQPWSRTARGGPGRSP
jgi:hypothetical protein